MSLVLGLVAAFIVVGLATRRFDLGVYVLLGLVAGFASVVYALGYFYL